MMSHVTYSHPEESHSQYSSLIDHALTGSFDSHTHTYLLSHAFHPRRSRTHPHALYFTRSIPYPFASLTLILFLFIRLILTLCFTLSSSNPPFPHSPHALYPHEGHSSYPHAHSLCLHASYPPYPFTVHSPFPHIAPSLSHCFFIPRPH